MKELQLPKERSPNVPCNPYKNNIVRTPDPYYLILCLSGRPHSHFSASIKRSYGHSWIFTVFAQ